MSPPAPGLPVHLEAPDVRRAWPRWWLRKSDPHGPVYELVEVEGKPNPRKAGPRWLGDFVLVMHVDSVTRAWLRSIDDPYKRRDAVRPRRLPGSYVLRHYASTSPPHGWTPEPEDAERFARAWEREG